MRLGEFAHKRIDISQAEAVGIEPVILLNKMDLVDFSHEVFEEVMGEVRTTAARLGVEQIDGIPVSAVTGANITTKSDDMLWYKGESLLGALAVWEPVGRVANEGFRFPVQFIVRAQGNFRGYAGTVVAGSVRPGDEVMVADSGRSARIDRIVTSDGDLQEASSAKL